MTLRTWAEGDVLTAQDLNEALLFTDDSGWVNIPPAAGATSSAMARLVDGVTYFKGTFMSTAATFVAGTTALGTIPPSLRPAVGGTDDSLRVIAGVTVGGVPTSVYGYVTAAGVVTAYLPSGLANYPNRIHPTGLSGLVRRIL